MREPNDKPTRRGMLIGLGAGAVGAAAAAVPALQLISTTAPAKGTASWWARMFTTLRNGSMADWSAVVGQTFTLAGETGSAAFKLVKVKPFVTRGARPATLGRSQAFAVIFESSAARVPAGDRTYTISRGSLAPFPIFMSPKVKVGKASQLIAVFN